MKTVVLNFIRNIFKWHPLETLLQKCTAGKFFGHWITKLPPNPSQYPVGSYRMAERNGILYRLDLADMVDWYVFWAFEQRERNVLYNQVKCGFTILDIGANIGEVSMNLAKKVGNKGAVHSFEPHPTNFSRLKDNLEMNSFTNISINQFGLGNAEGKCFITQVDLHNKGMNRIRKEAGEYSVELSTIDQYMLVNNISRVDLIKIDTEGFEFNILIGGKKTLSEKKPILFIELDDRNLREQNSSAMQLVNELWSYNYSIFNCYDLQLITPETDLHNCQMDILATLMNQ